MPESECTRDVVREWVARAENDLLTAAHTLKLGAKCPTDTVAFHAQQTAERYLKALLVLLSADFPKTHDIERLLALVPPVYRPTLSPDEQARLTDYATVTRYPGDQESLSLSEARRAVPVARRVRRAIRKLLPRSVLRKASA